MRSDRLKAFRPLQIVILLAVAILFVKVLSRIKSLWTALAHDEVGISTLLLSSLVEDRPQQGAGLVRVVRPEMAEGLPVQGVQAFRLSTLLIEQLGGLGGGPDRLGAALQAAQRFAQAEEETWTFGP